MTGSLQLREYPADMVRLECAKCGRAGRYRKEKLIEQYGADIRLPEAVTRSRKPVLRLSALFPAIAFTERIGLIVFDRPNVAGSGGNCDSCSIVAQSVI